MYYSIHLLLKYTDFSDQEYISYCKKKRNGYASIEYLSTPEQFTHVTGDTPCLYVCQYETVNLAKQTKNLHLPDNCGLIILDSQCQWDPFKSSAVEILGDMKNDILVLRHPDLFYCINQFSHALKKLNDIVRTFSDAVCHQKSLAYINNLFYDILGNPAYIVDSSFKVLAIDKRCNMRDLSATWRRLEDDGYLPYDLVNNLIQSAELHKIEDSFHACMIFSNYFYVPFINYNLRKKGRLLGHLFVINMFQPITSEDIELVSLVGNYVAQSILNNPKYQNERGQLYEYFLNDIFSGRMHEKDNIRKQLMALGYQENIPYVIAMIHSTEKDELRHERILSHLERFRGCKPFHYNSYIAVIIPFHKNDSPENIICEFRKLAENMQIQAGISDSFLGCSAIYHCALQAFQALEYLLKSNSSASDDKGIQKKQGEHVCSYKDCFFTDYKEKVSKDSGTVPL